MVPPRRAAQPSGPRAFHAPRPADHWEQTRYRFEPEPVAAVAGHHGHVRPAARPASVRSARAAVRVSFERRRAALRLGHQTPACRRLRPTQTSSFPGRSQCLSRLNRHATALVDPALRGDPILSFTVAGGPGGDAHGCRLATRSWRVAAGLGHHRRLATTVGHSLPVARRARTLPPWRTAAPSRALI